MGQQPGTFCHVTLPDMGGSVKFKGESLIGDAWLLWGCIWLSAALSCCDHHILNWIAAALRCVYHWVKNLCPPPFLDYKLCVAFCLCVRAAF